MSKKNSNKNDPTKKQPKKPTVGSTTSFSYKRYLICFTSLLFGAVSFYMYNVTTSAPQLPKVDPNYWWGPLPMDPKQDLSVRPYMIEFSEVMINDLKERLLHTHPFTPPLENVGFTYGVDTNFMNQVVDYWRNSYDFKAREKFFNKYEHFKTNIQGLDMHFMRIKPRTDGYVKVYPLLMLHGWPGSIREFYEIIPLLTTPRKGRDFVFEVIAPSLPGYGFSQAAVRPGLNAIQTAVIMNNLMKRIGHEKYYVQGGDWGHQIGSSLATLYPDNVLGFHTNCPVAMYSPLNLFKLLLGAWFPSLVVEPELQDRMYPLSEHFSFLMEEFGYMHLQATKPDTIGVALTDSPAGLAAYILEKFSTWTNRLNRRAQDGDLLKRFQLTHLLDNVMVYWATDSITTSMRLYAEQMAKNVFALRFDEIPTPVPTWGIKFKHELLFQPDSFLRTKFQNYLHSTIVDDGGHFAAFEMPTVMADDIFDAVDTFVKFHRGNGGETNTTSPQTIYDFTVKDINGGDVKLDRYKGHVCIIVNVASQCGYTENHYKQLNQLYEKYGKSKGLRILAFPCNQFGNQEPGTAQDIIKFTKSKQVKFDLFEKIEVNGDTAHPLWNFLKQHQSGTLGDFIKWNFSKFIIDKNGVPVERFGPNVDPLDLESYLEKYW